jgi:glycosyltransferase involved in cell wall biosynthesis
MDVPRVTVITPSYNQAPYLEQTVLSVLGQDYPNLEYMVVDGGSTDGSVEIIHRYAEHFAWWVSEQDRGQAEAINKGFARASGEFIGWLNSDDLYRPGSLSAAVEVFRRNPEVAIVYGDVLSIDAVGNPLNLMRFGKYTLDDLLAFQIISQPGVLMRRSALEQAGYLDTRFHYMLDHHLWLRIARLAPMAYLPRVQACARFHAAAKNLAHAPKFGEEALQVAAWLMEDPRFSSLARQNQRRVWGGAYRVNGWYLVEGGRPSDALRSYARSFANHPRAALADWRRIMYACLSLLGLSRLKNVYYRLRQAMRVRLHPSIYGQNSSAAPSSKSGKTGQQ